MFLSEKKKKKGKRKNGFYLLTKLCF